IMVRALGLRLESGESIFSDVKGSDWYSSAVQTAAEYKLINGFEDGTFRPNERITREQAMVIVGNAMTLTDLQGVIAGQAVNDILRVFSDAASISTWAKNSIADSVQAGIISGRSNEQLAPKAFISRAEVAIMVKRLLQNSELI
ncbi:MAG: S-layer protein, partial [Paenibacillus sp.]|nr:S-layer protein [Paenibacillus sp.]